MKKTISIAAMLFFSVHSIAQQELVIPYGNNAIYGVVSTPFTRQNGQKRGVAIISHGFNGTHHFGVDYFKTLDSLGYQVYSFDFPYGSVHSQSGNNTMNMSVVDEKNALKAIVRFFRSQKDIDKHDIVLIGESQGGLVSALAASELRKQVRALVLVYPAFCIPDNWNSRYPDVESIPDTTRLWDVPLGKRYFIEVRDINPYKTISAYKGPVLVIHGDKDNVVPLSYSEKSVDVYKHASLKVISGAGHGFSAEQRKVSNQHVCDFLNHLIKRTPK
ncbi:MAG: alpha/beta hydrolase [Bacteroides sp.]|nr:alpha/beta hydrolase [Roseburia sp.]MCM1346590.1 alpha/beta hydrolase [Bacteroides sp.]MCM1420490.1 alpha/beta hydrolase [Bacteroides sp.]